MSKNNPNLFTTVEAAKFLGVNEKILRKWRTQEINGIKVFEPDVIDHDGVYLYDSERLKQLKSVYHSNWRKSSYKPNEDSDSECPRIVPESNNLRTVESVREVSEADVREVSEDCNSMVQSSDTYTTAQKTSNAPTIEQFKAKLEELRQELDKQLEEQEIKIYGKAQVDEWNAQKIRENTEEYRKLAFKENKIIIMDCSARTKPATSPRLPFRILS